MGKNKGLIEKRLGLELCLERVLDKDLSRAEKIGFDQNRVTTDPSLVLDDPSIKIVIELIGGIEPARTFITRALKNGKFVVTANKDLMARHGQELLVLARENNSNIFYEGSVGGGIPLIRSLRHSLIADRIHRVVGIVNGTTNYIFTRMAVDDLNLQEALAEAQKLGFAEANPTNDVEGLDAAYKLVVLAGLVFGIRVDPDDIYIQGITRVAREDIAYARELGYSIKLLAIGEQLPAGLALRVHPALVPLDHPLSSVLYEFNAVFIEGDAVGELMYYGRGAGAKPTATAVLADVAEAARSIQSPQADRTLENSSREARLVPVSELINRFYLRFLAEDRPGVFAALANAFGDEMVSLDMVIQKRRVGPMAEIVLVTHKVHEAAFQRALEKAMKIEAIKPNPSMLRLLG